MMLSIVNNKKMNSLMMIIKNFRYLKERSPRKERIEILIKAYKIKFNLYSSSHMYSWHKNRRITGIGIKQVKLVVDMTI